MEQADMSKTIELSDDQFNTLMTALTTTSLRQGQALETPGTYAHLVAVKAVKDEVDALITHLTTDVEPGVKSVDEARSIVRKDKEGE
jgi:hypothetical protein